MDKWEKDKTKREIEENGKRGSENKEKRQGKLGKRMLKRISTNRLKKEK